MAAKTSFILHREKDNAVRQGFPRFIKMNMCHSRQESSIIRIIVTSATDASIEDNFA